MSVLLIKGTLRGLHHWLKTEVQHNRRSLNQQVLICLEWCMKTHGVAQRRNPFAKVGTVMSYAGVPPYAHGQELASRLGVIGPLDTVSAVQM